MVNVRHILIAPEKAADATEATPEAWEAARVKAEDLYKKWQDSGATEDAFSQLAKDNTTDTGSAANGGLYEGVYKGQMEATFNDWSFAPERKPGDNGIIKSSYGYHLMYFVGQGDSYWTTLVKKAMQTDSYNAWFDENSKNYQFNIKKFGMKYIADL